MGIFIVRREIEFRRAVLAKSGNAVNPVGRYGHRRRRRQTALETQNGSAVKRRGIGARALHRSEVAFRRIVIGKVGIVLKGRIADADSRADYGLFREAVSRSQTRRKVVE